ncbi:MAG: tyrosine-type recombinase/integrase [Spirochaetaceae bacterium]|nr:tyrosine-type recombinase/integrase [Spirochaetaceae bacterium]
MAEERTVLNRYYSHLVSVERRARLTAETYRFEMGFFLDWLKSEGLAPEQADSGDLIRYVDLRRNRDGIDVRSVGKAVSVLRSFYRFMVAERMRADNPAELLEGPRKTLRLPSVHPRERVDEMLNSVDTGTPTGLRDRALFEFIYSSGIRVSEAVTLNIGDIFFSKGIARVLGKGSKERLVVFGAEAEAWLKRYVEEARPILAGGRRNDALFIGRTGKRLSRKGIWKNYAGVTAQIGMSSRLHSLRHSYATEMLSGGADLRSVQELLGHADLATTQIYTHVDNSMLRENHRRYLPKLGSHSGSSG